jgi:hypothetical protein
VVDALPYLFTEGEHNMKWFSSSSIIAAVTYVLSAAASGQNVPEPLISISAPQQNGTYQNDPVRITVHFSADADAGTLEARLNGADITKYFEPGACASAGGCDKSAEVLPTDLATGDNLFTADVQGANQSAGTARTKFEYQTAGFNGEPIRKMIPAVAVQSVDLVSWQSDPRDINNYQIVVGPGPGFPRRTYSPTGLGCNVGVGINSMQILVLGRKSLDPDKTVASDTSHPGQACLTNSGSIAGFLKSLPAGDVVIAHSFTGMVRGLDTTAIGGSTFPTITGLPQPYYYSVIGVAGAKPGTAYESYDPVYHQSISDLNPLKGSLMLTFGQDYFFVPSQYRAIQVIPNDPAYPGNRTSTVMMPGADFHGTLPNGANGGFLLVVIDRMVGNVQLKDVFATNSSDPNGARNALRELGWIITQQPLNHLIILTTIGVPFASPNQVSVDFFTAISALGGNGYMMPKLVPASSGQPPTYTLINSMDSEYRNGHQLVENSSLWSDQKETGEISGFMKRDRKNSWFVDVALTDQPNLGSPALFTQEWEQVAFEQAQDWPQWTPGQQLAYQDLTSSASYERWIGSALGCGTSCQPIRAYYDGGIGSSGQAPPVTSISYDNIQYNGNPNYTAADLQAVTQQLAKEEGYLRNVYALYGQFRQLTTETSSNVSVQLSLVAQQIQSSIPDNNSTLVLDGLSTASAATAVLSLLPGAGAGFGAVSTVLGSLSVLGLIATTDEVAHDGYEVTLNDLAQKTSTIGTTMANSTDVMFTAIVNDWGKLQTIGFGYGSHTAPWYFCPSCKDYPAPRTALPAIAWGAKRMFYQQLLGQVFRLDVFFQQPAADPTKVGSFFDKPYTASACHSYYYTSPQDSWLLYPSLNPTVNNALDMFIITAIKKTKPSEWGMDLSFPSQSLLDDLFMAPEKERVPGTTDDYRISGGAGFARDQFYTFNWESDPQPYDVLLLRPAEKNGKPVCILKCKTNNCVP